MFHYNTWEQIVNAGILFFWGGRRGRERRNCEFYSTLCREMNVGVSNVLCMPQQLSIGQSDGTVLLCKLCGNKSCERMSV